MTSEYTVRGVPTIDLFTGDSIQLEALRVSELVELYNPVNSAERYSPEQIRKLRECVERYQPNDGIVNYGYFNNGEGYMSRWNMAELKSKLAVLGIDPVEELWINLHVNSKDQTLWVCPNFMKVPQAELTVIIAESEGINFSSSGKHLQDNLELLSNISAIPPEILRQVMGTGIYSPQ